MRLSNSLDQNLIGSIKTVKLINKAINGCLVQFEMWSNVNEAFDENPHNQWKFFKIFKFTMVTNRSV